jgi:hypothetical protein
MLICLTPKIGKKSQGRVIASFSPCLAHVQFTPLRTILFRGQSQISPSPLSSPIKGEEEQGTLFFQEIATPANGKTRAG